VQRIADLRLDLYNKAIALFIALYSIAYMTPYMN